MKVHWFHRTEARAKRFYVPRPAQVFELTMPAGASLDDILVEGYQKGFPMGSARGGCFELQTDEGIWARPDGKRMRVTGRNGQPAIFKTWEQLEAEEQNDKLLRASAG